MRRRTYLSAFAAGVATIGGCTGPGNSPTTETEATTEDDPTESECGAERISYEDHISYVSSKIHTAGRETYELLDDSAYLRAGYVTFPGDEVPSVVLPPNLYRERYIRYILSTESVLENVAQNKARIDEARTAVDRCDVPLSNELQELLDDVEKKTDHYVSAAEAFVAAAEIYHEHDVELGESPSAGGGAEYVRVDRFPDPPEAREWMLEALKQFDLGRETRGVPADLTDQLRFAER